MAEIAVTRYFPLQPPDAPEMAFATEIGKQSRGNIAELEVEDRSPRENNRIKPSKKWQHASGIYAYIYGLI